MIWVGRVATMVYPGVFSLSRNLINQKSCSLDVFTLLSTKAAVYPGLNLKKFLMFRCGSCDRLYHVQV